MTTKLRNQKRDRDTLPARFKPKFWRDVDGRCVAVKVIRRRYESLKRDAGIDCVQTDLIAQRAVFVAVQLETMEIDGSEGKPFDPGVYTQMVNCLLGLLKALGLTNKASTGETLRQYVSQRES